MCSPFSVRRIIFFQLLRQLCLEFGAGLLVLVALDLPRFEVIVQRGDLPDQPLIQCVASFRYNLIYPYRDSVNSGWNI